MHAELHAALTSVLQFGNVGEDDSLVRTSRSTADRWIKASAAKSSVTFSGEATGARIIVAVHQVQQKRVLLSRHCRDPGSRH